MALHILGSRWGRFLVGSIQFAVCYNNEVLCALLGGQCMKAIYVLSNPNGTMKLYEFVVIFGCFMLILGQNPVFPLIETLNMVSLVMCLAYSACATAASIYIGISSNGSKKDYSVKGDATNRLFGVFNAIPIIATTYGSGIIPEIQIAQLSANGSSSPFLQPTNVLQEQIFGDPESPEFSPRNLIPRLISRSLAIITATTIAAMLPFFGGMNSFIGAFGYIPLDFILPMIFFNVTFKPSKRSPIFWLNVTIVLAFSTLGAIAIVAAVRQIVLDAKTFRLLADV
uniref:Lysine histidine transporter-like 1 n=1 Tax=Cajanus cajan TaxID=3821 RepID=A0A151SAM6_CAJCA|nr:Lysine histidine transporter-like 1 [Cajanus cajan]